MPKVRITKELTQMDHVRSRLMFYRKRANIRQKDIADNAGISQQAYSLMERGKRRLDMEVFFTAINTIGITPDEFMKGV